MAAMKAKHCVTSARSVALSSTASIALLMARAALAATDTLPMAMIALMSTSACKVLLRSLTSCSEVALCAGTAACSQICLNTEGSYSCTCAKGFRINEDGLHCDVIDTEQGNLTVFLNHAVDKVHNLAEIRCAVYCCRLTQCRFLKVTQRQDIHSVFTRMVSQQVGNLLATSSIIEIERTSILQALHICTRRRIAATACF